MQVEDKYMAQVQAMDWFFLDEDFKDKYGISSETEVHSMECIGCEWIDGIDEWKVDYIVNLHCGVQYDLQMTVPYDTEYSIEYLEDTKLVIM
ncbi:hypothetical protein [Scytonema sp. NUACC26]|uniref:hypothetical protein n=1 Tax=Scytonema sp. NUACC26 TaxID=3140176 RepID=UPI0034DC9D40